MNEPTPPAQIEAQDSDAPPAAPEPAPAPADFGTVLRAARETAGISVATLAGRLRLHVKQIEALERADLAALPNLIYVRGFLRSCARELKIDPAPLVEDLDRRAGVIAGSPLAPAGGNFPLARLGDGSRSVIGIAIVVLVIAGIVGTLWPRRVSTPPAPPVAAPALAEPAPAAPDLPAGAGAAEPLPGAPVTESRPAAHAPAPPGGKTVPGAAPLPGAGDATPAVAEPVAPAPDAAASAPAPKATADGEGLVLHVHAPSWVEVVQANGTSVFSQICPAGSVQVIHGVAPLRVVIGNAASVDAQYHGAVVDLNRYANVNGVARLTLQ